MSTDSTNAASKRYHPMVVTMHWLVAILIFATFMLAGDDGGGERRGNRPRPQPQQPTVQQGTTAQLTMPPPPAQGSEGDEVVESAPPAVQPTDNAAPQTAGWLSTIGIHMLLGTSIILLLIIRLIARWTTKHPEWATTGNVLLDKFGWLTHLGLYVLAFLMPITGIVLAYQRGELARTFGIGPVVAGGFRRGGFSLGMFHGLVWALLVLLVLLHIGASLYHQFIKKDNLMARMWYGK